MVRGPGACDWKVSSSILRVHKSGSKSPLSEAPTTPLPNCSPGAVTRAAQTICKTFVYSKPCLLKLYLFFFTILIVYIHSFMFTFLIIYLKSCTILI